MDEERKETPKEALNAGESHKHSETSSASSSGFEKPLIALPESNSEVKMQQSDVKETKSTVLQSETAIKESVTDKESKSMTESLKTEVKECESSVRELELALKENNGSEVKKSQTAVTPLKDLAQKAAGSVKDTATNEPKGMQSSHSVAKSETSISTTKNPETELAPKLETNVKESNVPKSGIKDLIKEKETEIKDCAKKEIDSVGQKSDLEVKQPNKKGDVELKQTDSQAEDIRSISKQSVSETKSLKEPKELIDIPMEWESDCRTNDEKKSAESPMETDTTETVLKESKSEIKAPKRDSTCPETVVQDSCTVVEDSEMECSDIDSSSATIVISDVDMSIDKSDGAADILLSKEKQPESKSKIEKLQTEIKDTDRNSASDECMIIESVSETNKVKEIQDSVEKLKIAPEASKSEIKKTHESQKLSLPQEENFKTKDNKIVETERVSKESSKVEACSGIQGPETDAVQMQSKVSKMDKQEARPRSADTVIADVQNAAPSSENSKGMAEAEMKKVESSVKTPSAATSVSTVSEEQEKLTKMELSKPVLDTTASVNASAGSKEQKKLADVESIKPGDEKAKDGSSVLKEPEKLPAEKPIKPGDEKAKDASSDSKEQKKSEVEPTKSGGEKGKDALPVSEEQKRFHEVETVKPGVEKPKDVSADSKDQKKLSEVELIKSGSEKDRDSSSVSKEQTKLPEVGSVKPGDEKARNVSAVSKEQKKLPEVQTMKTDDGNNPSRDALNSSKEQKKLPDLGSVKPGDEKARDASALSKEQKKLPEMDPVKTDGGNKPSRDATIVSTEQKSNSMDLVKPGNGNKSVNTSTVSKEQRKLTEVEVIKPNGGDKTSVASAISKEQKKLAEVDLLKPDIGDKVSRSTSAVTEEQKLTEVDNALKDAPAVLKEQKKLTEVEVVKACGGDDKSPKDASTISKEQKKLTQVELVKPDGANKVSKEQLSAVSKDQKKLTEVALVKPDVDKSSGELAAVAKEQKKLMEGELVKPDDANKASKEPSAVLKDQKKLTEVKLVKSDGDNKASKEPEKLTEMKLVKSDSDSKVSAVSKEPEKLTEVKLVKPTGDSKASAVSKEPEKLTEMKLVKPDGNKKASKEPEKLTEMKLVKPDSDNKASAVSKEPEKSAEMKLVKPVGDSKASREHSTDSEKQKKLTEVELGSDKASKDVSVTSKEQKKLTEVKVVKPDGGDNKTKDASGILKDQRNLSKVECVKPVSHSPAGREALEEQKKLDKTELPTPDRDITVTVDIQPASSVSEVSKKLTEVEASKPENTKTVIKDVQHTKTNAEQRNLAKSDLVMDVQPSSAVSEKLERLTESDTVKPNEKAAKDAQSISAVSEESKKLTEADPMKKERMDIQLTSPSVEEQKKLGEPELVKPDTEVTVSTKVKATSAISEVKKLTDVNLAKAQSTITASVQNATAVKEPKRLTKTEFTKPEEGISATVDIQSHAGGNEESEKLTKSKLAKPEECNQVITDIQNTATGTEQKKLTKAEPEKLKGASSVAVDTQSTKADTEKPQGMELVKTQRIDKVTMDTAGDSKEQKRPSEEELMKPSAMKDAPKESKSETGEQKSVKGVEEEQISEKSPATEALISEVSKIDTELQESTSKGSKDEKLPEGKEEVVVLNVDDDNEEKPPDVVEIQEEAVETGKNEDSTRDAEEFGSDDTYCSRASSATPELYMTQESEREVSGTNGKHMSQATTIDVGDLEALTDSEPDMFASQSQAEDLNDTVTPPYKEFAASSQDKGRGIKSSSTLESESQDNEDKMRTSIKRKHDTSDSSDALDSSVPRRKEPRVDICDTEEEEDIVPASAPEAKPMDIIQKSGSIPKLSKPAVSAAEDKLSPKSDRKRPAEETSPKLQRKLTLEDEPQTEPVSVRKKLKLNTDESETQEKQPDKHSSAQELGASVSPEVELLEARNSRKSIEVVYMKQPSTQWSSTPQKEKLDAVEESKEMETEEEVEKDEFSDSQDLILRLSPSPSQMSSSFKAQTSPALSNSTHKSETVSNSETPEEAVQQENSNGHMETIVEVEEPKAPSVTQNGDKCTVIDLEKEDKVKLGERLKRKRDDTPVIEIHGSDSECDSAQTPDDKKRKTTENGHKDTPPLPLPVHLLKEREKKHSTPDDGAHIHALVETSASSIELEHEKDTHPEASYNEETVAYVKKVTLDVLLKVEVSKQGNRIVYQGVEQCKVMAEDDYQPAAPGISDLSSGNLADTSATGSPSSIVSGPGPFALPNNRLSIMTTSSSSSGGSSTAFGVTRGRTISTSDVGLFSAPSLGRVLKAGKDSFQSDVGVSANKRIEHMDVIEDVLTSVVDVESDMEKRTKSLRITETSNAKENVKEIEKKSFCDAFTTMNTSPAQVEEDKVEAKEEEEQVEETVQPLQETPKVTKKRFVSRVRSTAKTRSVASKSKGNTDDSTSSVPEERKSKEQEKQEVTKSVQEAGKRSTRVRSNSSHSEDAQTTKSKEAPLKRSTRKQSNSEASEITDESKASTDVVKRVTRKQSDSNTSSSESKEKSTPKEKLMSKEKSTPKDKSTPKEKSTPTPTPTAKRSSRKRSNSDTPETRDDSKEPKAKQMAVSIPKRSTRNRSDSSFTESTEETKGRTSSSRSSLEMQDNNSSKAATPFTPKTERKKEKEAAVPQTPEHVSAYTLKEMKPGLAVFAKWTDRKYYSAKLKEVQTDKRWVVEFDDGKSKPLLEDYIIAVDQLSKGQLVYAMNEEEEFIHGVIKNVEKRGRKETYTVELDEGETVTVTRKELFMTEDQAKILRENVVTTPVKTTPHRLTELTLDNVVEGKRSRSKKNLDSPSQSPGTSGENKKRKVTSSSSSEIECVYGGDVDGVQRESTGPVISRRIKGQGTGNPKKNVEDYGVMPKDGNLFKGKCFLITSTDAPPPMQRTAKQFDLVSSTTEESDSATEYTPCSIPFSKAHVAQQIQAGGGTVYNKFEDIPSSEYKKCFLISDRPNLTAKYILCLINNIPLVSHIWIFQCCKTNTLESYSHHLLPAGWSLTENKYVDVKKTKRLLNNMKIGLVSESKYFLKFWETVLKAAGASVFRVPPEGVSKQMKLHAIISNNSCPFEVQKDAKNLVIPIVSTTWIVQCLINGTQVPFDCHPQFGYDSCFSD